MKIMMIMKKNKKQNHKTLWDQSKMPLNTDSMDGAKRIREKNVITKKN